jgi:hypothetical protein
MRQDQKMIKLLIDYYAFETVTRQGGECSGYYLNIISFLTFLFPRYY